MRVPGGIGVIVTVSAIAPRRDDVLLVRRLRKQGPSPRWFLPDGKLKRGEYISQVLKREVS